MWARKEEGLGKLSIFAGFKRRRSIRIKSGKVDRVGLTFILVGMLAGLGDLHQIWRLVGFD
jgi:hypothetical protein